MMYAKRSMSASTSVVTTTVASAATSALFLVSFLSDRGSIVAPLAGVVAFVVMTAALTGTAYAADWVLRHIVAPALALNRVADTTTSKSSACVQCATNEGRTCSQQICALPSTTTMTT